MPSGVVHSAATTAIIVTTIVTSQLIHTPEQLLYTCIGAAIGYLMTPDLDVDNSFIGFAKLRRVPLVGWPLSFVVRLWWKPYAIFMPHRSFLSHFPVVSTLVRIGYVAASVAVVGWVAHLPFSYYVPTHSFHLLLGLVLSDSAHYWMDLAYEPERL